MLRSTHHPESPELARANLFGLPFGSPGGRWKTAKVFLALILAFPAQAGRFAAAADPQQLAIPIRAQKDLVYGETNGHKLRADIYRPVDDRPRPGVLMIHGGAWSSGDKWNLSDHARELAQAGYVAININYRLAPLSKFPAQIEDCRRALQWVGSVAREHGIDARRLAVYGYSAGGHLAALLATEDRHTQADAIADAETAGISLKVAVVGGAPCEFDFLPPNSLALAHVMGGSREQVPEIYREASPLTHASADDCPVFFFHGENDILVPPASSRALCDRLNALGVETRYFTVEKQGHLITFVNPAARRAAIEFLDKHLGQEH